jgi:N-hydroxyarylamine O-acetyltransferase
MKTELDLLFRKRIGLSESVTISFEMLASILERTAFTIPFENTCLIFGDRYKVTKENLKSKILVKNEGGLCYELNPLLYYFLLENGFNVSLVRGVVYNQQQQRWSPTGRTHAAILLLHNGRQYLIDTGFGVKLPLKPVPLSGEKVISANGVFRIDPAVSTNGDYMLVMNLTNNEAEWSIGYCFDTRQPVKDETELDEIQQTISIHSDSSFNKQPLLTKLTKDGHLILTDDSFTEYMNGEVKKAVINHITFKKLAKKYFAVNI